MKKIIWMVVLSLALILVACNESSSSASSSSAMKNAIPEYTGAGSVTVMRMMIGRIMPLMGVFLKTILRPI